MNEYSLGLLSGFSTYLLVKPTTTNNKTFDTDETKEAPTCIMLAYKMVFERLSHAVWINVSVYIYVK